MHIVLCGREFPPSVDVLAPLLPDDTLAAVSRADLPDAVRRADVLVPMMTRLDSALIAATSARLIQQWGAGLEGVDIAAASARGIFVCNVPSDAGPNADSTAEHALLLMMAAARRLKVATRGFANGTWGGPLGESLFGKHALIVGFGRVGKALARRLVAMGMEVDAIRRVPEDQEAARAGIHSVGTTADLLPLAAQADFVVCTATATPEARGLLGANVFAVMKPTAFVVNVSRGAVVDEAALVAALRSGRIAGAGLDVFAEEPAGSDNPLVSMDNVFATPHIAGVTQQSYEAIAGAIADNVQRLRSGRALRYCANFELLRERL